MEIVHKIKDFPTLIKKSSSSAVLSTDDTGYKAALRRRELEEKKKDLEDRVAILEQQMQQFLIRVSPY